MAVSALEQKMLERLTRLEAESEYTKRQHAEMEAECKELREEIAELKDRLAEYTKYGWFVMGAIGFGMLLTMGFEKARDKLLGWFFG